MESSVARGGILVCQPVKIRIYWKSAGEHQSQTEGCRGRFWQSEGAREWEILVCVLGNLCACPAALALHPLAVYVSLGGRHWVHVHIAIFPSLFHLLNVQIM